MPRADGRAARWPCRPASTGYATGLAWPYRGGRSLNRSSWPHQDGRPQVFLLPAPVEPTGDVPVRRIGPRPDLGAPSEGGPRLRSPARGRATRRSGPHRLDKGRPIVALPQLLEKLSRESPDPMLASTPCTPCCRTASSTTSFTTSSEPCGHCWEDILTSKRSPTSSAWPKATLRLPTDADQQLVTDPGGIRTPARPSAGRLAKRTGRHPSMGHRAVATVAQRWTGQRPATARTGRRP